MSASSNVNTDLLTIAGRPWPTTKLYTLQEWRAFLPFPGHRNSQKRALRATHLFTLRPEHVVVEAAILVDHRGKPVTNPQGVNVVYRLTGNTRVAVWENLLSNEVPPYVMATLYSCYSVEEIIELGSHFDSRQASWSASDQAFRAVGMAFQEDWRPSSSTFKNKSTSVFAAMRRADAISTGHMHEERATANETILPQWLDEYRLLDSMLENNVAESIQRKNFDQANVLTAMFLLLRAEDPDVVRQFFLLVFADHGFKDNDGYDGVQIAIESIYPQGRAGMSKQARDMTEHVIRGYMLWRANKRQKHPTTAPLDIREWFATALAKKQRDASKIAA